MATSTDGSVDIQVTFRNVCGWLHDVGAYLVSHFIFFCCFVTDVLDLELYRSVLDSSVSMAQSIDLQATPRRVSTWLSGLGTSLVSRFCRFRLADFCRFNFDSTALTPGSNDPIGMYGVGLGWLHESGTSMVSDFVFSHLIDTNTLDLESSVFAPRLPQHPGYEGKYLHPSDSLSRSP